VPTASPAEARAKAGTLLGGKDRKGHWGGKFCLKFQLRDIRTIPTFEADSYRFLVFSAEKIVLLSFSLILSVF
jgi:hypothetical protein